MAVWQKFPRALQVAERSLFLWNNEYIVSLVAQQRTAVLPLVFAALERNERNHWNPQAWPFPTLLLGLLGLCQARNGHLSMVQQVKPWTAYSIAYGEHSLISTSLQVLGLTSNVRKMFKDMDETLYEECRLNYEAEEVRYFQC